MNANGKLVYWLLGFLATLLTGATGGWLSTAQAQARLHGEKIAVLESQMAEQHRQLERIDRKIDRLLDPQKGPR